MTLTVDGVAHPFAPVGLDAAGGAEQVLGMPDEALVLAGHRLPDECRGAAREHFDSRAMVDAHLKVYRELAS